MSMNVLKDIRKIYAGLNAQEVRASSMLELRIGLLATSESVFRDMEDFLVPPYLDAATRGQALRMVYRLEKPQKDFDFILCEPGIGLPRNGFLFDPAGSVGADEAMIESIADESQPVELSLARNFPAFRAHVSRRIITRIARENALLALATALPNVIPGVFELPWAVGEFATDTAFLTMNQIRMALMLAAIYDRPVGYAEQKTSIAAIAAGAFGWRAVARELVGKIPLGGGLIPKASIAFAGTWVVGTGLDRLYRTGIGLTRRERRETWKNALEQGKEVASELHPQV